VHFVQDSLLIILLKERKTITPILITQMNSTLKISFNSEVKLNLSIKMLFRTKIKIYIQNKTKFKSKAKTVKIVVMVTFLKS
jgi:hypothetical protein